MAPAESRLLLGPKHLSFQGKTSLFFGKETPQGTPLGIFPGPEASLRSIYSELLGAQHKLPTTPTSTTAAS